jgi:hypothetical protein
MDSAISDFVSGLDKHLMINGFDPKVLSASMADPKQPFSIALQSYSAGIEVASKLLVGSQEGKLASEEDARFTMSAMQSRREDWGSIMVSSAVDWLMDHGIIQRSEYYIEWDDLLAPSDKDKLELGSKLSKILIEMHKEFGETPTELSEVAAIMGYKPLNEDLDVDEIEPEIDDFEDDKIEGQS